MKKLYCYYNELKSTNLIVEALELQERNNIMHADILENTVMIKPFNIEGLNAIANKYPEATIKLSVINDLNTH